MRCHIAIVCGKPCTKTTGGPDPAVRVKIVPASVAIECEAKSG